MQVLECFGRTTDHSVSGSGRVSSDSHQLIYPFAAVGIDYFGPLYVHAGPVTRSATKNPKLHKRYGCIFTCPRYQAMFRQLETDK